MEIIKVGERGYRDKGQKRPKQWIEKSSFPVDNHLNILTHINNNDTVCLPSNVNNACHIKNIQQKYNATIIYEKTTSSK